MRSIEYAAKRLHILGCAIAEPMLEPHIEAELIRRDYRLQSSELRAILEELVANGLLTMDCQLAGYEQLRVYHTTPAGRMAWAQDCRALSKLADEVFGTNLSTEAVHPGVPVRTG